MGFLAELADQVSSQFSLGENTTHTLDQVVDGQLVRYGSLGDFAKQFDQSAERKYVEEGYLRRDPYNAEPKQFEILMQEPNATVMVKKRMFSSIAENFRPDFMDNDEKLYYKAMKVLFQNKCRTIGALEKLSKIQQVSSSVGSISDQLLPIIITLSDTISSGDFPGSDLFGSAGNLSGNSEVSSLNNATNQLRRLYGFNTTSPITTWLTDDTNLFQSQFGAGTGVIEITNFTNLNTTVSVDGIKNPGSFSLNISDPYESMLITEWDIEKAISDATNMFNNHSIFQFGKEGADQVINDAQTRLNQLRSTRGASPISFRINPDTLLGRRVTAIFDRIGTELRFGYDSSGGTGFPGLGGFTGDSVSVAPDYLKGGAIAGFDGLDTATQKTFGANSNVRKLVPDSELSVFQSLVTAIYNKLQLEANARNAFQTNNKNTNYARRKLRFNFSGKLIIQPMDTVHIYVNTKSRYDTKLLSGLNNMFSGYGILQNLDKTITDFKNTANALFNPSGDLNLQAEKAAFVGPEFPNTLWNMLRSQFVTEKEGTHIFAGVVESAVSSWSSGRFSVDVRGKDNTAYFDQGKINFKPGVDVFNGAIFDPLTPFKSNFDMISSNAKDGSPELLDENISILGTSQDKKGLLKAKLGPNAGQKITSDYPIQDVSIDKNRAFSKIFYAPDGLVYKWKEGIGVFVQFGNSLDMNDPNKVGNPNIFYDPFAGQDVMNVLSLLVTGQPYNFSNFYRAAQNINGFGRDPQSQQDAAHSYISSLRNDLTKTNALWGNFIPFKNLVIDEKSFALATQAQFRIIQRNKDLDAKIQKINELNRQAAIFGAANAFSEVAKTTNPQFLTVKSQITQLQQSIQSDIDAIQKEDQEFTQQSLLAGPDATYDFTDFLDTSKVGTEPSNPNIRKFLRKKINFLTRRLSYNVRANVDKNLFIVDDFYDKDYDLLAYNQALADGIKLYTNEFTSVRDKIINTADLLNLEVFADTQGHIRVRPPQYNRMPSSVFYRMMYLKQSLGIQVFPQFIDDFFSTQIETLRQRIEIVEDLIRLDCAILNNNDDISAASFIHDNATAFDGGSFYFISDNTGSISDINSLIRSSNPDQQAEIQTFVSFLEGQATSNKNIFTNTQKYSAIVDQLTKQSENLDGFAVDQIPQFLGNTYVDQLISRIQTKSAQRVDKHDYIVSTTSGFKDVQVPANQVVDVFKVVAELQNKIQERNKVVKSFYAAIKNTTEFRALDQDPSVGNQLTAPAVFGNSNIPEVFEHMIEDEKYDDYGLGSGTRFIIKRPQIRNISISENPPDYTMVSVQGVLNTFAPNALPEALNSFPDNGNGLTTAVAIDYDAWRNYGFKNQATIKVPFLSDPVSQCAPYASMILSRNRKNIHRGTITISGNEFMQPGEVVFLEDRGMLFYVSAVRHNFTFGSSFTTSLDLTYGHTPGEYIPTTLDIIGKMIYNNRDAAEIAVQRQSSSGNESNLGVVIMDPNTANITDVAGSSDPEFPPSSFSAFNSQTLNNIMYSAAYVVNANNTKGNNIFATVELRIYHDDANAINNSLQIFADEARKILIGLSDSPGGVDSTNGIVNQPFPPSSVKVVPINLDDENDRRSPSQKAIDAARGQSANSGSITISVSEPTSDEEFVPISNDKIRAALFGYIVDCWIFFESIPDAEI